MERNHSSNLSSLGRRKGTWSQEEDYLLRKCIEKHGEGNWYQVPLKAGLKRCRRSCRLRWLNYLKPTIKRGEFAEDEIDLILRLHRLLGNRWALIAGRIPGRTANDIKNFWNSHLSKKHKVTMPMQYCSYANNNGEKNLKEGNLRSALIPQTKKLRRKTREEDDAIRPTLKNIDGGSILKPSPTKNSTPSTTLIEKGSLTSSPTGDADSWWKRILFEDGDDQQLEINNRWNWEEEAIDGGGEKVDEQDGGLNLEAFWKTA